jgi:hypothetical protein
MTSTNKRLGKIIKVKNEFYIGVPFVACKFCAFKDIDCKIGYEEWYCVNDCIEGDEENNIVMFAPHLVVKMIEEMLDE